MTAEGGKSVYNVDFIETVRIMGVEKNSKRKKFPDRFHGGHNL